MPTELLFRSDAYSRVASARVVALGAQGVELDRTLFYPLGGGQPGDSGTLVRANGERLKVVDTRKGEELEQVVHVLEPGCARPEPGEELSLELDWERRYALMRLHTALHLLSCVVPAPVSGGNISPDKGRLDFDIEMSALDPERIAAETNHGRGARGAAGAGEDDERAAAARRGSSAPARDSGHRPAAVRRHARAQHRRDRQDCRGEDPE
jgi:misacylated tRNA(Ala) deacylase